jgi:excisionase family DNA binding protein
MDSFEKMYAVKEAAAILGFSPDTVLRLIRRGELRAWKLPGSDGRRKRQYEVWRIPHSELVRFLKRNSSKAA